MQKKGTKVKNAQPGAVVQISKRHGKASRYANSFVRETTDRITIDGGGDGSGEAIIPVGDNPVYIQDPVDYPKYPNDPIVSEVAIVPQENGGGIVPITQDVVKPIDTNMNPESQPANPGDGLTVADATQNPVVKSKSVWPWLILIIVVGVIIYLTAKKK